MKWFVCAELSTEATLAPLIVVLRHEGHTEGRKDTGDCRQCERIAKVCGCRCLARRSVQSGGVVAKQREGGDESSDRRVDDPSKLSSRFTNHISVINHLVLYSMDDSYKIYILD